MPTLDPTIVIVGGAGALATEALTWVLTNSGRRVQGAYRSVQELEAGVGRGEPAPQLAIVDTDDPLTGPSAVADLRRAYPKLKILLLCEVASRAVINCAIDEQAEGVVLKSDPAEEVIVALGHVLAGRAVMPAGWYQASLEPEPDARLVGLSEREREVLDLAVHGMTNREIAERLVISQNTVKYHLRTIYSRLKVHNRVQAMQAVASVQDDVAAQADTSDSDDRTAGGDELHAS